MSESKEAHEARKENELRKALMSKRQGIIDDNITDPKIKRIAGQLLLMSDEDMNTTMQTMKLCGEAELTQEERETVLQEFAKASVHR